MIQKKIKPFFSQKSFFQVGLIPSSVPCLRWKESSARTRFLWILCAALCVVLCCFFCFFVLHCAISCFFPVDIRFIVFLFFVLLLCFVFLLSRTRFFLTRSFCVTLIKFWTLPRRLQVLSWAKERLGRSSEDSLSEPSGHLPSHPPPSYPWHCRLPRHSHPITRPAYLKLAFRDFGFGKAGMEGLINEEVAMFIEEVRQAQDNV